MQHKISRNELRIAMRKGLALCVCGVALLAIGSPASAKGKHISCQFTVSVNDGAVTRSLERTMNLYLDDTYSKLVGEGGDIAQGTNLNVRTVTYSDSQIDAEVSTGIVDGRVSSDRAALSINRLTGFAVYAVNLLPRGAEAGTGPCHEVAAPGAKF